MTEPRGLCPVARSAAALAACVLAAAPAAAGNGPTADFLEAVKTCMAAAEANSAAPFAGWPAEDAAPSLCGACTGRATRFTLPGTGNRVTVTEIVHPALGAVLSCEMNLIDVSGGRVVFDDQPEAAFATAMAWIDGQVAAGRLHARSAPRLGEQDRTATATGTWSARPEAGRHYAVGITFPPFPAALRLQTYPADFTMCPLHVS